MPSTWPPSTRCCCRSHAPFHPPRLLRELTRDWPEIGPRVGASLRPAARPRLGRLRRGGRRPGGRAGGRGRDLSLTLLSLPPPLQAGGDRVGGMDLTAGGFAGMAARLRSLARGRVVFALEGGYKPSLAAKGVLACVRCAPPPPLYRTPRHYVQQPAAVVAGHHLRVGSVHAGLGNEVAGSCDARHEIAPQQGEGRRATTI